MLSKHFFLVSTATLGTALLLVQSGLQKAATRGPVSSLTARAKESLVNVPLSFESNRGQADPRVKFTAHGLGYTLFLTGDEAVLAWTKPNPNRKDSRAHSLLEQRHSQQAQEARSAPDSEAGAPGPQVVRMKLLGANSEAPVKGVDELPGKANYFLGNDPAKWRTNVSTYTKVRYEGVYPGVDLVYYGNQRRLEYDFVVAPGTDPGAIRFGLTQSDVDSASARTPRIDSNGDLVLNTGDGEARFQKPAVYQTRAGKRVAIDGRYRLNAKGAVGFDVPVYDRSQPLIIDPVVIFSTYFGGVGVDFGRGIAVDSAGNAYVAGETSDASFLPTGFGPGGPSVGFVAKFSPDGSSVLYSAFVGGSSDLTFVAGIAVDSSGEAFVAGSTDATDFPTQNAMQTQRGGPGIDGLTNAFLFKLSADGSSLLYSTYIGGSGEDHGFAVAADDFGFGYVTGETASPTSFPRTFGTAIQPIFGGGPTDAFLTVIQTQLSGQNSLVYSSFLGGDGSEAGQAIALADFPAPGFAAGSVYVTGFSSSDNFPTMNAFQGSNNSQADLAFLTRFVPQGSGYAIAYSTYFGGQLAGGQAAVAQDTGIVVIAGVTSDGLPVMNAFQNQFGGGDSGGPAEDGFFARFATNQSGQASLLDSSYLGGSGNDTINGIAGCCGLYWVAGFTDSSLFPVTPNALQPVFGGGAGDAFLAHISTEYGLLYSSYLGGPGSDVAAAVALSPITDGTVYVTGSTDSNFPVTNPIQGFNSGQTDAFVAKIMLAPDYSINIPPLNVPIGSSAVETITMQSIDEDAGLFKLVIEPPPPAGLEVLASSQGIILNPNGSGSATMTIGADATATPATYTLNLNVAGPPQIRNFPVTVNVTATTMGAMAAISAFQSAGCIDNSGIANALASKLAAAQADADNGQTKSALNTYNAFLNQIQAQSGKHIVLSCTVNTSTVSPPAVLSNDVRALMANLKAAGGADPILGYVVNAGNNGVGGATVGLFDVSSNLVASATTDGTGFYYFANTAGLTQGATYTVQVTGLPGGYSASNPPTQSFAWGATPVSLGNFTLN